MLVTMVLPVVEDMCTSLRLAVLPYACVVAMVKLFRKNLSVVRCLTSGTKKLECTMALTLSGPAGLIL